MRIFFRIFDGFWSSLVKKVVLFKLADRRVLVLDREDILQGDVHQVCKGSIASIMLLAIFLIPE